MSEKQNIPNENSGKQTPNSKKEESKNISQPEPPQTTNMETHAHHLHKVPGKKWTHYLFEFLMLFLAVFCGFLAEYQLEHKIERERAKQYIRSFYADLITDTTEFSNLITKFEASVKGLANRRECYEALKRNIKSDDCLTNLFAHSYRFADLIQADQTLLQLKNAGGLRLLDKQDADSILLYDKMIRAYLKRETTGFQERQYKVRDAIYSLANYDRKGQINENKNIPALFSVNKELLNRYFNLLDEYYLIEIEYIDKLKELKQKAAGLIAYFKNQ